MDKKDFPCLYYGDVITNSMGEDFVVIPHGFVYNSKKWVVMNLGTLLKHHKIVSVRRIK